MITGQVRKIFSWGQPLLLAYYFFKCSQSEQRIVKIIRPLGKQPIRRWVVWCSDSRTRPEETGAGEISEILLCVLAHGSLKCW